jgi:hypothetical protein
MPLPDQAVEPVGPVYDFVPNHWALMILQGLQSKPMYAGTVPAGIRKARRAKNRRARRARAIQRGDSR